MFHPHSFANLDLLIFLNLSKNILLSLGDVYIDGVHHMELILIDCSRTKLQDVDEEYFVQLGNPFVITDNLEICCWRSQNILRSKCLELEVVCTHLSSISQVKYVALIFSCVVLTLNLTLILVYFNDARRGSSKFTPQIMCLHVTESFHGIGLGVLYTTDFHYRELLEKLEHSLSSSITCSIHFIFSFTNTWSLIAVLVLMSFTQAVAVKSPFHANQKTKRVNHVLVYIMVLFVLISVGLSFAFQIFVSLIPFKICSLQIVLKTTPYWTRLVISFLLLPHMIALSLITYFYCIIWHELKTSHHSLKHNVSNQQSIKHVLIQLGILDD